MLKKDARVARALRIYETTEGGYCEDARGVFAPRVQRKITLLIPFMHIVYKLNLNTLRRHPRAAEPIKE